MIFSRHGFAIRTLATDSLPTVCACADLIHPLGSRNRPQFEKLATAAASVLQTSNTVTSLVS